MRQDQATKITKISSILSDPHVEMGLKAETGHKQIWGELKYELKF